MNLYGQLYAVAAAAGTLFWWRRLVVRGVPGGPALLGIGAAVWAGLAGAFGLHQLVAEIPGALPWPGPYVLFSGSTVTGAILGGSLATCALARFRGDPGGTWLDALAGAAPLAQAIGRLGCLSAGCCYGRPTASWLGMVLPDTRGVVARRYPTQLIASAADLGILAAVLIAEHRLASRPRPAPAGLLFALYLGLYGVKRFLLEFLRATANPIVAGLTWAQLVAIVFVTAALSGAAFTLRTTRA